MSRATKRKHLLHEVLQDDFLPPTENQQIVRVLRSPGNNLHEVEAADKSVFLMSMPRKFRNLLWIKRGDYVLVEPIEEGGKVKAEMVKILSQEHIKNFKKDNVWPKGFEDRKLDQTEKQLDSEQDDLFANPNRPASNSESSDSDSDSECNDSDFSEESSNENEVK